MSKHEGVVGYISSTPKYGSYSFTIKGVDGFFKTGETRPPFKSGSFVRFEADDQKMVAMKTLESSFREDTTPSAAPKVIIDPRLEQEKSRQRSIHFQSAHKDAIEITKLMMESESIKLPTTLKHRYDAVLALVDELTNRFFTQFENGTTALPQSAEKKSIEEAKENLE